MVHRLAVSVFKGPLKPEAHSRKGKSRSYQERKSRGEKRKRVGEDEHQ